MNSTNRLRHIYLGVSAVAALLIFVVDVVTPPGIAVWPLYLIPLAIAAPRLAARGIYLMSAVVTALIVLGTLLSSPGIAPQFAIFNDGVGIAFIWAATWLAVRRLRTVDGMRRHEQELDELVKSKTDELQSALARYTVLFEVAPVGVSITDEAGNIVESNLEARKMVDAARQVQLGQTFHARAHVHNLEVDIVADDGSIQWLTVNAAPIPLPGYGVAIICTDITARKQMEGQLRESGEQYRFLTENIKDVIWTVDLATRQFTYISPSVTKMRGFAPAEIIGQPATSGMTVASARYVDELLDTLVAEFNAQGWTISPEFHSADIEELCKDGSTIWSEAVALIRRNAQTGGLELHGVTRDISQRKQLQDALRESEQRYRMLADHATDVIWSLDAKLDFAYVSPAVAQVTGYSPEEFMQYRMADLLTPASAQLLNDQVAKALEEAERTGQPRARASARRIIVR